MPGLYRVRVRVAQRNTSPANQGVRVLVDGVALGTVVPANNAAFVMYNSATFVVARPSTSGIFPLVGPVTTDGSTALNVVGIAGPSMTDVDGNGRLDLLVGNQAGNVLRFEQTTVNGSVFASAGLLTTDGTIAVKVNSYATTAVTDVDGDGLLDLLVGNSLGNLARFEQTTANGNMFASVGLLVTGGTTALDAGNYAAPIVTDVDGNGLLDLLVGNQAGNVLRFEQTAVNGAAFAFVRNLTTNGTTAINVVDSATPAVTDVDGNGRLDLLVGSATGRVQRYEQTAVNGDVFALVGNLTNDGSTALAVNIYCTPGRAGCGRRRPAGFDGGRREWLRDAL